MSIRRSYISSPVLTFGILCTGLGCIVSATLSQNLAMVGLVAILPVLLCIFIIHLRKPERFIFLLFIFNYFFTPLARYSRQDGLSVLSDILWWSIMLAIVIQTALHYRFPWKQSLNILTIGGAILAVYCLLEAANPTASIEAWIYSRGFIYNTFLVSLITVLLATSYRQVNRLVLLFSILTLAAILKGLYQKIAGFDSIEYGYMMESGMYKTHLLPQITRYFSIFTDAGNYGSNMGFACTVFGIVALSCKKFGLKVYYLCISALSLYSMFITGTRGAIVVPLGGLLLFALISKNIRLMSVAAIAGCFIYVFFAFTYIGESNTMISRMRTAFRPSKDASYLVRKQNQQKLAEYLRSKPFGEGLGLGGVEARKFGNRLTTSIPNDSTYVKIWTETGIVGITLYLLIYAGSLLWGCYYIMFKVRNPEFRHLLTALACGIFGMMISAYGNAFFTQFPTGAMMIMFLGILMNGKYIDERLTMEKQQALLTATKEKTTI
ncbi:O-antigen ligase [Bacteroides helcogenes]|uniref:O-antigen ligase-related domain-containing protein n=1 Tax=Bacteroides helcogenes (strain ATCC 35417 / DSM 20613 / JCM 6297 / CCUG 15421 / P 36-108) TaxID=693979 RepID=E6SQT8_BACT6|nr:O-antigen ligase family protein [Bacteroides helcogenes]ADV44021.1 hypothetical protein Bache_2050 [Bacteroides helcogenes P 36-108]MDY5237845.1 O-antigen ligase family protein [Bacteroides helcogenes]